ncbi:MAG: bifunctional DNA-formamidopyrimidine glycosylase/DNA-(apurinic or apyrimidinic site) lyase [Oligoflexales bacterium]
MPELPEVETVASALRLNILGKKITSWQFHRKNIRFPIPTKKLQKALYESPSDITRRGKYLHLHFPSQIIQIHLGMSGALLCKKTATPPALHTHVTIEFNNGELYLHYVDPRRFGFFLSFAPHENPTPKLGPEPLSGSSKQLARHMHQKAANKKVILKSFLLNQSIVAGLGNIYICEALFLAKLNPETLISSLSEQHWQAACREIRKVLRQGIRSGGTTLKDFRSTDEKPGYFAQKLSVYGREGEPCKNCSSTVQKKEHSGRSTYFCGVCQK